MADAAPTLQESRHVQLHFASKEGWLAAVAASAKLNTKARATASIVLQRAPL